MSHKVTQTRMYLRQAISLPPSLFDANIHIRELEAPKHGTGRLHWRRVPPVLVAIDELVAELVQSVQNRQFGGQRRVGKVHLRWWRTNKVAKCNKRYLI